MEITRNQLLLQHLSQKKELDFYQIYTIYKKKNLSEHLKDEKIAENIRLNVNKEIFKKFKHQYNYKTFEILNNMNQTPYLFIRVNNALIKPKKAN